MSTNLKKQLDHPNQLDHPMINFPFINFNGLLAVKGPYKLKKFCEQCGAKVDNNNY